MILVDRYQSTLIRLALLYVGDRAAAEDVVQETWLGVFQGIDRFEARSSLKTWLFRILTNRAKRRGERDHRSIPFSAAAPGADDDTGVDPDRFFPPGHDSAGHWSSLPTNWDDLPEERFLAAETRAAVDRAIAALPPTQREVITLRDVEGGRQRTSVTLWTSVRQIKESSSTGLAPKSAKPWRSSWVDEGSC